jgi:hypothetical protein
MSSINNKQISLIKKKSWKQLLTQAISVTVKIWVNAAHEEGIRYLKLGRNRLHTAISSVEGICQMEFLFSHFCRPFGFHLISHRENEKHERELIIFE